MFGKEEGGGGFQFNQELIDEVVSHQACWLTGDLVLFFPALHAYFLRPLVHLCISDANKAMLVQSAALIPALLDALFLDPEHPRKDMDETLRAGIQRDGAECLLQLALFESGKELLERYPEALEALRALVDGSALTGEARRAASGALVAVEGPQQAPAPSGEKHIVVSCTSRAQMVQLVDMP